MLANVVPIQKELQDRYRAVRERIANAAKRKPWIDVWEVNPPPERDEPKPLCAQVFPIGAQHSAHVRLYYRVKMTSALDDEVQPVPATVGEVLTACSRFYGFSILELCGPRRHKDLARARQIGMYVAHKMTGKSLPVIGRGFGDRDHTTVLHGVRKIERIEATDKKVSAEIQELMRSVRLMMGLGA